MSGMNIHLVGEANDFVGKILSSARLIPTLKGFPKEPKEPKDAIQRVEVSTTWYSTSPTNEVLVIILSRI
ncbi:hypothetical protein QL285_083385 [Trifolium repens]|nr:hypothetical protein QL285_083385 [Trifolium repens]